MSREAFEEGDLVKAVYQAINNLSGNRLSIVGFIEHMPAATGDLLHLRDYDTGETLALNTGSTLFLGLAHVKEHDLIERASPDAGWGPR